MLNLNSPITELPRVGRATALLLKKLGLDTVQDLLFYFPFRYEDFSQTVPIADLSEGATVNITGTIELIQNKKSPRRRMYITEALISDATDSIKAIWFNQPFLTKTYHVGDRISLAGRVSESYGSLALVSPVAEKIYSENLIHTAGLVPNYHLTANLTQKQIRFLIKEIITLAEQVPDWLPADIKKRLGLLDLPAALRQIHFPKNFDETLAAQKRLGFTELFLRQLKAQMIKRELKSRTAPAIKFREEETRAFVHSLPFRLTDGQRQAAWEILKDLSRPAPMSRLLEGDVGSGKTIVVILALLNIALDGRRAVFMVPTEILARQHFNTLNNLLATYPFKIALLTASQKQANHDLPLPAKKRTEEIMASADIIIGTHALIYQEKNFNNLALAVVDEQHRFGVTQRKKLLEANGLSGQTPHFLSLTATPIPRSLALAIYGDLDLSIIAEKPLGRKEIMTKIVTEDKRRAAYDFIRAEIKAGRQALVICPLIDQSDKLGVKSVKEEHAKLDKDIFPELRVGLLHGRLPSKEKEKVMADFVAGKTQILVSTSVIEVGVDVPNATLMIIEGAERFGLAQLHQFRGRVGRSDRQSYCFLFPSTEELTNTKTIERLEALTKYQDGLTLAKIDLKLRGAGELYGLGQSGFPEMQIASLFDYENIKKAQAEASALVERDPELKNYPALKEKLGEWETATHLE